MAEEKTIIIITGGNGGISFSLATAPLFDRSKHVLLCNRSLEKGEVAVKDLETRELLGTVEVVPAKN